MKRLLLIPALCLVGCSDGTMLSNEPAPTTETEAPAEQPTTETNGNEEQATGEEPVENDGETIDDDELTAEEILDEKEEHVEEEAIPLTALERNLFNGAVDAIDSLLQWDSYHSVKTTDHVVRTNPDNSYSYKHTLSYMKQPHETHLIYESENPQYMEIYANDTDGMYANDSADEPNWTYTMDRDTIEMWQEEPLPDTAELLRLIATESETFTVVDEDAQMIEFSLSVPSTTIDDLLDVGDSEPPTMFLNLTLTMTFSERGVEEYKIVSDYVTQENDEGQITIEETFTEVNNLANVRVPAHVKEQAVLDDEVIEWNE